MGTEKVKDFQIDLLIEHNSDGEVYRFNMCGGDVSVLKIGGPYDGKHHWHMSYENLIALFMEYGETYG